MKRGDLLFIILIIAIISISFLVYHPNSLTGKAVSSQVGNFSAGISTFISCTWSDSALAVNFGNNLNPGSKGINATQNYALAGNTGYNVVVDELNNVLVDITIKGSDLVSGENNIDVSNIKWQSNVTTISGENKLSKMGISLTKDFNIIDKVASNVPFGGNIDYRFWFDVPAGQVAGNYFGSYTMKCEQA